MRAAFRTLATLTPRAWGFSFLAEFFICLFLGGQVYAADNWSFSVEGGHSGVTGNPYSHCLSLNSYPASGITDGRTYFNASFLGFFDSTTNNPTSDMGRVGFARCSVMHPWYASPKIVYYVLNSACSSGSVMDSQTGECIAPPEPCSTTDIYAAVSCSYVVGAGWVCPGEVCRNSCAYTTSPNQTGRCDSAEKFCVNRYTGNGNSCSAGADACTDATCADAPAPSEPAPTPAPCTTYQGTSVCITDDNTGCGTVNGVEGCFTPGENCGTYNGTFTCFPQDKPQSNCGYANGQKVCFDPNNPTQQIPPTSADHPNNGGNADGNDNNDPMNPADTSGTSPQGSSQGATNESVDDLGEKLGEKIDKTNSLLDGITGILNSLKDGLLGDKADSSAEWSDSEATTAGSSLGQGMSDSLGTAVDDAVAARDEKIQAAVDAVPATVDGYFGSNGQLVPGINSLGKFFPSAQGCSDYKIPINVMGFNLSITLPVCFLSSVKPLIEWVLWCLTAIGLWNIFYSGLRLENAKASKGGY